MIRVGTKVRLQKGVSRTRGPRKTAVVIGRYSDIKGGLIIEPRLDGFRSWNVQDLERADQK